MVLTAPNGLPAACGTCGKPATSSWSPGVIAGGHSAGQRYACDEHNPMALPFTMPLSYYGRSLCSGCGQPVPAAVVP